MAVSVPLRVIQSVVEYKNKALKNPVFIKNTDSKLRKKEILVSFKND